MCRGKRAVTVGLDSARAASFAAQMIEDVIVTRCVAVRDEFCAALVLHPAGLRWVIEAPRPTLAMRELVDWLGRAHLTCERKAMRRQ